MRNFVPAVSAVGSSSSGFRLEQTTNSLQVEQNVLDDSGGADVEMPALLADEPEDEAIIPDEWAFNN